MSLRDMAMSDPMREYRHSYLPGFNTNPSLRMNLLTIQAAYEDGCYSASSLQEPGWTAAGETWEELTILAAEFAEMNGYNGWVGVKVGPSDVKEGATDGD